jgi:hypothetical protein
MKIATYALVGLALAASATAVGADPPVSWKKYSQSDDGTIAYYLPASVQPIRQPKTNKVLGYSVWAGWEKPDGSYNKTRYLLNCLSGEFTTAASVDGTAGGVEENRSPSVMAQPYMPGTFVWALAEVICTPHK